MRFWLFFDCTMLPGACRKNMSKTKQKTKTDILECTIPLFAKHGYDKVSMRQIAEAVGIKAASLYHHFPDKQALYIMALSQAFSKHADFMSESFALKVSPEQRLRQLILQLCTLVSEDQDFSKLMQREIMDGDEKRLQFLADNVFGDFFSDMNALCLSFAPEQNPHLMTVSVLGLVIYHFQLSPIRSFLPGFQDSHNDSEVVAEHIFHLLIPSVQ